MTSCGCLLACTVLLKGDINKSFGKSSVQLEVCGMVPGA